MKSKKFPLIIAKKGNKKIKIKINPAFERMSIHLEAELLDGSKITIIIGDDADLEQIKLHAERILNAFEVVTSLKFMMRIIYLVELRKRMNNPLLFL